MSHPVIRQAAVIPIRRDEVCLVLSRSGKRWLIPKGHIEAGQSAGEAALQEAWEEAGLVGVIHPDTLGAYRYFKDRAGYHVTVFVMHVTTAAESWPEEDCRQRRWLPRERALGCIEHSSLRRLLARALVGASAAGVGSEPTANITQAGKRRVSATQ